ncbi:MAG: hypothetical protein PHR82_00185 [Endomicrobiaceae bacterium]|nr:hypothetical protein [Endomicrobiaceae bacterium]
MIDLEFVKEQISKKVYAQTLKLLIESNNRHHESNDVFLFGQVQFLF